MVIELSGVQFGLKSVRFEITSMISDQNYMTRSSISSLFRSILKSHNFIALNFRFWCIVPLAGLMKIAELEMPLHSI